jgi:hypothetical protein
MVVAGVVTVAVYVLLLRLLARRIINDALGILPVPDRYAAWGRRLLGLRATQPV